MGGKDFFQSPWLYLGLGACCACSGILLIIGGFLLDFFGNQAIRDGTENALVISESEANNNDPDFLRWMNNVYMEDEDDERVPLFREFFCWNITNPNEVLMGAVPVFEEVGSYTYRQRIIRNDPEFQNGQVSYNLTREYIFYPEESTRDPTQDIIYNINPSYAAVILGAGQIGRAHV